MPELILLTPDQAAEFLYQRAFKINPSVMLFKQSLLGFVKNLYEKGYVLAKADEAAYKKLLTSFREGKPIQIGKISFFFMHYAQDFLISQAEDHKLPVQLIKKSLEQLVLEVYAQGYIFGTCVDQATTEKVKKLLAGTSKVILEIKEPTNATLQDHTAGGVQSSGPDAGQAPASSSGAGHS